MKQVRIGMIGVGGRGYLAGCWHQPDGRSVVTAGADISMERLEEFRSKINPDAFVTTDYREMLAREDVDAVAVTAPDRYHEEFAIAALNAGKHVFCEKPLAITTEGCDRILAAARKSGKRLMAGHNMRYMNMFRTMKGIADSGVLGEIKAVWVRHFVGRGGSYYYHDWHGNSANTTSLLLQKGSHDIDIIHWITGRYTKRVSAIGGLDYYGGSCPDTLTCPQCELKETCPEAQFIPGMDRCAFRKEIDVEDNSMVMLELEGGIKASYLQCHFTPDYQRNYVFIGTKGRMENSEPDNKVYVQTRKSGEWQEHSDIVYEIKEAAGGHGGADPEICRDFVDMILDGREPVATPEAGRMSVAAGAAAAASMRGGGFPVEVSPIRQD
ncbi:MULTISPECIES: Gfo/Idh/MocA family protein [unclassified Paenibacillus]|uniref:Gfo/Idh/MocA family protein n=1 Tax=unclassified Paenibacillus TaxID=185978 RepID=UPI000430CF0C|nr:MULTISPECIES: Gfo/Idh/MocA family oxidoreductase [unclassified Paenibacillus]KKC49250.1 oxidoreductase [Paenibacillus sp. D9]CDN42261.1 Inositol 2-dehydrogenase [Paenibacillus sp. P22]